MLWDILRLAAALIILYTTIKGIVQRLKESNIEDAQAERDLILNTYLPFRDKILSIYNVEAFAIVQVFNFHISDFVDKRHFSTCMFVANDTIYLVSVENPNLSYEIPISKCKWLSKPSKNFDEQIFILVILDDSRTRKMHFCTRFKKSWIGEDFEDIMNPQPLIDYLQENIPTDY